MNKISKVVMPVAGLGTRSLPASKNIPKEMLSVFNKPVIQYVVEEALEASLSDVVFITGRDKTALEDHFDHNLLLESTLEKSGKLELLEKVRRTAQLVNIITVRQKQQLGLGHAVLCAEKIVHKEESFGVMVGDDIFVGHTPNEVGGMKQLIDVAQKENVPAIGVLEVDPAQVNKYGIISGNTRQDGLIEITDMVEKPALDKAPSTMAIIGRYVLTADIFQYLHKTKPGHGGEIQLTDALKAYALEHKMLAVPIKGRRFDAGNWIDYFMANLYFGIQDNNLQADILKGMKALLVEFDK